jgi:hypothetical protein
MKPEERKAFAPACHGHRGRLFHLQKHKGDDPMSTTIKQIEANRENALHSTGPRTEAGKQTSSSNALTTGLTATRIYVPPEDQPAFDAMKANLVAELNPSGELQLSLFISILHATWNAQRCITLEAALQNEAISKTGVLDAMFDDDFARKLDRIYRYKRMHDSTQCRAITELRKLQTEDFRRNEANPPIEPAVSVLVDTTTRPAKGPRRKPAATSVLSFDDEIRALTFATKKLQTPPTAA